MYAQEKSGLEGLNPGMSNLNQLQEDIELKEKFAIPRIIKIALLLTGLCVFPLIFVLISEFSYIIINTEKNLAIFIYESIINMISTILRLIWTFL
jgi:hypothetical protein